MLYLSTKLSNIPLLSIRHAGRIGVVIEPIINPHNLHIDAFYCHSAHSSKRLILLDIFVRELTPRGLIINDHHDLSEANELVRLQPVIKLNFQLVNKPVLCGNKRIGKVLEYAIEKDSLFIQKLYVQPPVWQSFSQDRLTIDRRSVTEITDAYVKVSGPEEKSTENSTVRAPLLAPDYSASTSLIKE